MKQRRLYSVSLVTESVILKKRYNKDTVINDVANAMESSRVGSIHYFPVIF